jgi:hypothetical protein
LHRASKNQEALALLKAISQDPQAKGLKDLITKMESEIEALNSVKTP